MDYLRLVTPIDTYTIKSIVEELSKFTGFYKIPDGATKTQSEIAHEVCVNVTRLLNETLEHPGWKALLAPPPPPPSTLPESFTPATSNLLAPPASGGQRDLSAAWAVLQTPGLVKDAAGLQAVLDDYGFIDEEMFVMTISEPTVDVDAIKDSLAGFLRLAGAIKFRNALKG